MGIYGTEPRPSPNGMGEWGKGKGYQEAHVPQQVPIPTKAKEKKAIPALKLLVLTNSTGKLLASGGWHHSQGWEEALILKI